MPSAQSPVLAGDEEMESMRGEYAHKVRLV